MGITVTVAAFPFLGIKATLYLYSLTVGAIRGHFATLAPGSMPLLIKMSQNSPKPLAM